jgi:hypothetical protein
MNGKIDALVGECLFDFTSENAFIANRREGYVRDLVSGCVDDVDVNLVTVTAQPVGYVVGLP